MFLALSFHNCLCQNMVFRYVPASPPPVNGVGLDDKLDFNLISPLGSTSSSVMNEDESNDENESNNKKDVVVAKSSPKSITNHTNKKRTSNDLFEEDKDSTHLEGRDADKPSNKRVKHEKIKSEEDKLPSDSPVQEHHQDYPEVSEFTPEYIHLLQTIQDRISNPQSNDNLAAVISLIQQTGCFSAKSKTFDFDLCLLDRQTVEKIQQCLDIQV